MRRTSSPAAAFANDTLVYRLQLNRIGNCAAFLIGVFVFAAALAWVSIQHFVIRTLADERLVYRNEVLLPAISRYGDSPRIQKRVFENYLMPPAVEVSGEVGVPNYQLALEHATQAVRLSPRNGHYWYWLAQAQEGQDLVAEAEQSLWQAAALAPADSRINWGLANVLVRAGKVDESVVYFRRAAVLNPTLYPQAFDTLWQAGGRKPELLREICSGQLKAQITLAQYLIEQKLYAESATLYESLVQTNDRQVLAAAPQTNEMLNQLLNAKQAFAARQFWLLLQPTTSFSSGAIWDGSFEVGEPLPLPQFVWQLRDSAFARVGYDDRVFHSGRQSLKLLFTGRDSTILEGELRQWLALESGRRYRFEAQVKGEKLVFTEGPRFVVTFNGNVLGQSEPLASGTWDWQPITFDLVAPAEQGIAIFDIIRRLKLAYDPPVTGALWFDDLKLTRVEN